MSLTGGLIDGGVYSLLQLTIKETHMDKWLSATCFWQARACVGSTPDGVTYF